MEAYPLLRDFTWSKKSVITFRIVEDRGGRRRRRIQEAGGGGVRAGVEKGEGRGLAAERGGGGEEWGGGTYTGYHVKILFKNVWK